MKLLEKLSMIARNRRLRRKHKNIVDNLRRAPIITSPLGWRLVTSFSVGGLEAVGFDPEDENLLVVSSSG